MRTSTELETLLETFSEELYDIAVDRALSGEWVYSNAYPVSVEDLLRQYAGGSHNAAYLIYVAGTRFANTLTKNHC